MARQRNRPDNLIAAVAKGDRKAFKQLYDAHAAKLFGVAVRILRRTDLAEEVLQDAFLKIWERAGDYDARYGAPATWMTTIVRNRALDVVRKHTETAVEDMPEATQIKSEVPLPSEVAEQNAALRDLVQCMTSLKDEQQRAILLAYHHGMTHTEIAEKLSIPVGTIKSFIRRGLAHIRTTLSDD